MPKLSRRCLMASLGTGTAVCTAGCVETVGSEKTVAEATAGEMRVEPAGPIEDISPELSTYEIVEYQMPLISSTEAKKDGETIETSNWYIEYMDGLRNHLTPRIPEEKTRILREFVGVASHITQAGDAISSYSDYITRQIMDEELAQGMNELRAYYNEGTDLLSQYSGFLNWLKSRGVFGELRDVTESLEVVIERIDRLATTFEQLYQEADRYVNGTKIAEYTEGPVLFELPSSLPRFGEVSYPFQTLGIADSLGMFDYVNSSEPIDLNYLAQFYLPPIKSNVLGRGGNPNPVGGMAEDVRLFRAAWGDLATALNELSSALRDLGSEVSDISLSITSKVRSVISVLVHITQVASGTAEVHKRALTDPLERFKAIYKRLP